MPQLDPSSFSAQIFWLFVSFIAMYVLMANWALPRVSQVLQARRDKIAGNLEKAQALRDEAKNLSLTLEKNHEKAALLAKEAIAKSRSEARADMQKQQDALNEDLAKKQRQAEQVISDARAKAYEDMSAVSSELAVLVAEQVAGIKVDPKKAEAIVTRLMKEAA